MKRNIIIFFMFFFNSFIFSKRFSKKNESIKNSSTEQDKVFFQDFNSPNLIISSKKPEQNLSLNFETLNFTQEGIAAFFSTTFNSEEYANTVLPNSFMHITQFLEFAIKSKQPQDFVEGVLRLFNQKIKSANYINPSCYENFLIQSTPFFVNYNKNDQSFFKYSKKTLKHSFKNQFDLLQNSPLQFFDKISSTLDNELIIRSNNDRLRFIITKFLSQTADKLIWCHEDQLATWSSFKTIGNLFSELYRQKVITDKLDLNDLHWSLIERYCFFLNLTGSGFSIETCNQIKKDISNNSVEWLLSKEQDKFIQTKTEKLAYTLLKTEAKILSYQKGIITEALA